jgi:hypothetical protein
MTTVKAMMNGATAAMMQEPMKRAAARRDYVSLIAIIITNHSNY